MGTGGGGTRVERPLVNYGKLSTVLLSVLFLRGSLSVLTRTLPCPCFTLSLLVPGSIELVLITVLTSSSSLVQAIVAILLLHL